MISRHGSRYPTTNSSVYKFGTSLASTIKTSAYNFTGDLSFLNSWSYKLGAEILVPIGRQEQVLAAEESRTKAYLYLDYLIPEYFINTNTVHYTTQIPRFLLALQVKTVLSRVERTFYQDFSACHGVITQLSRLSLSKMASTTALLATTTVIIQIHTSLLAEVTLVLRGKISTYKTQPNVYRRWLEDTTGL